MMDTFENSENYPINHQETSSTSYGNQRYNNCRFHKTSDEYASGELRASPQSPNGSIFTFQRAPAVTPVSRFFERNREMAPPTAHRDSSPHSSRPCISSPRMLPSLGECRISAPMSPQSCTNSPRYSIASPVSPNTTIPPLKRPRGASNPPAVINASISGNNFPTEEEVLPSNYSRSMSCPSDSMLKPFKALRLMDKHCTIPSSSDQAPQRTKNFSRSTSVDVYTRPTCPETLQLTQFLPEGHSRLQSLAESAQVVHEMEQQKRAQEQAENCDKSRGKKLCDVPHCQSNAVTRGLCISHGGGRRCQRKGCTRGAQSKGLCVAHGGGRICRVNGCSNIQRSMGLCIRHGGGKRCSRPGCEKGVVRQDLCTAHGGKRKCRVPDCSKHVKKKGLCRAHANSMAVLVNELN